MADMTGRGGRAVTWRSIAVLAATPVLVVGLAGTLMPVLASSPEPDSLAAELGQSKDNDPERDSAVLTARPKPGASAAAQQQPQSPANCRAYIDAPKLTYRPARVVVKAESRCADRAWLEVVAVVESQESTGWRNRGRASDARRAKSISVEALSDVCGGQRRYWRGRSFHKSIEAGTEYVARLRTPQKWIGCPVG
ncbi:hypothetical protein [Sinosporangium siamense]|uniref:Uncharacterized protein n=1 Tax=Sinosporangium siamense TaxID=1367973 RepID=A0A919RKR0_9ACTN|nr:hypothetical protein [Sinosporangium siamense]GII95631.1 hypothetical protein Ssi02_58620 [Sinosporangium siamense]